MTMLTHSEVEFEFDFDPRVVADQLCGGGAHSVWSNADPVVAMG